MVEEKHKVVTSKLTQENLTDLDDENFTTVKSAGLDVYRWWCWWLGQKRFSNRVLTMFG